MPLYALQGSELVYAPTADRNKTFFCPGCRGALRIRGSRFRRLHFYHLRNTPSCRLYSKSEDHLIIQLALQSFFPKGQIVLEKSFFPKNRIADAVWEEGKIVFEIQCSAISTVEVRSRIEDYTNLGYTLIWILDDRLYNKKNIKSGEALMRLHGGYFARVERGVGAQFYDQFELNHDQVRLYKAFRFRPQFLHPKTTPQPLPLKQLRERKTHFSGDLIDQVLAWQKSGNPQLKRLQQLERKIGTPNPIVTQAKQLSFPFFEWVIFKLLYV